MGNRIPCGGRGGSRSSSLTPCPVSEDGASRRRGSGHLALNLVAGDDAAKSRKTDNTATTNHLSTLSSVSSSKMACVRWEEGGGAAGLRHLHPRPPSLLRGLVAMSDGALADLVRQVLRGLDVDVENSHSSEPFSSEVVMHHFSNTAPDLHCLVLDARGASRAAEALKTARCVRESGRGDVVVILGVVKKGSLERDNLDVDQYIEAGFNRLVSESSSRAWWTTEMKFALRRDLEQGMRRATLGSMLATLEAIRDIVQVTDHEHRLVFCNTSAEKILGFTRKELHQRNLWELQTLAGFKNRTSDNTKSQDTLRRRLSEGQVFEGTMSCRRKTGDTVPLETRAVPVRWSLHTCVSHIVYIRQTPPLLRERSLSEALDADLTAAGVAGVANSGSFGSVGSGVGGGGVGSGGVGHMATRKSIKSFRNMSGDVSSIIEEAHGSSAPAPHRRQSAVKLHSLSVEAPITKVINLILAAQENSPLFVAQALEKVLEILHSTDSTNLFSPEVEKERQRKQTDAVATDLLGALLAQGPKPLSASSLSRSNSAVQCSKKRRQSCVARTQSASFKAKDSARDAASLQQRRSSNDASPSMSKLVSMPHATAHRPSVPNLDNSPVQARQLLETSHTWSNFNVLELERLTDKRCLVWLGMTTLLRFDVHKTLRCSESTLQNWLTLIEANYNSSNSYHNSTHAADVLHATACFLDSPRVKEYCDPLDEAIALVAAGIHDVNHPGRNSAFLCNSNADLAILYNDITVLENHHASLAFKLTHSDERVNIFSKLDRENYKLVRQSVIDMVLATDMSKHFVHVNKFNSVFGRSLPNEEEGGVGFTVSRSPSEGGSGSPSSPTAIDTEMVGLTEAAMPPNTPENVAILKRMIIKCADVSNPARPLHICKEWAYRIAEEYFSQTDDEKRLGLPVVMPQFDRSTCSIPKSQIGFYDFFIHDMFDMFNSFAELPELTEIIGVNYVYWKGEGEREEEEKLASNKTDTEKKESNKTDTEKKESSKIVEENEEDADEERET